jgi:hypothetical protein
VTQINKQIQRLATVLSSPAVQDGVQVTTSTAEVPVEATVRHQDGAVYVFAAGMRAGQTKTTFTIAGLAGQAKVEVVDEGRSLEMRDGVFCDTFQP